MAHEDDQFDRRRASGGQVKTRPRGRSRVMTVLLLLVVVPLALLTGMRVIGIDGPWYTVAAIALTPYWAVVALLVGALSLLQRRWWIGGVALALAVTLTVLVLPRLFSTKQPQAHGQSIRVLSSNLYVGAGDPQAIVSLVRENRVDVLTLVELTPAAVTGLERAGLFTLLPNRLLHPYNGVSGSGIVSRFPLAELNLSGASNPKEPSARLDLGGRGVQVVAAHPAAPTWDAARWRTETKDLPRADPEQEPRIIAGDFNATLDHVVFRALLASGYHDAADEVGQGLDPTWPSDFSAPPVSIDHVLVDNRIAVTSFRVVEVPGSDHHSVLAEVVLP